MAGKLKCSSVGVIPLAEVSALAVRARVAGRADLVAMGDRSALVATADLGAVVGGGDAEWTVVDLATLPGAQQLPGDTSQVEALAVAGSDQLVVLWEHPNALVVCQAGEVRCAASLGIPAASALAASWDDPRSSHGEGLVLLAGGRLLVAKEKHPVALLEFGPAGAQPLGFGPGRWLPAGSDWLVPSGELVALAEWAPPKGTRMRDLSDAAVGPGGELLVLSDRDEALHVVAPATPGERRFAVVRTYRLRGLSGKPEGLALAPDGALLVATDTDHGEVNLLRVPPGWAS